MELAEAAAASGQGEVGRFLGGNGPEFQFGAARDEGRFKFGLCLIDQFARSRLLFFRQSRELFHQRGKLAVGTEVASFDVFEGSQVWRGSKLGDRRLFERLDLVEESGHNNKVGI